jgi:hypothetical protein
MSIIREALEWLAITAILLSIALLWQGCGATVTINILSSQSRFVHAVGTNQTSLATEGGGAHTATVPTP